MIAMAKLISARGTTQLICISLRNQTAFRDWFVTLLWLRHKCGPTCMRLLMRSVAATISVDGSVCIL
jgi:hypothetical protein